MRISTGMIYSMSVATMQQRQQEQVRLQQQISTGLRILKPSDDPSAAAAALNVTQSRALSLQYQGNGDAAATQLSIEESALASATSLLQDVKTLAVTAGNGGLSDSDRAGLAFDLASRYQELLGIANGDDGNGQYLFSGYRGATKPFSEASPGNVIYSGDSGQREAQISSARAVAISDSGESVFRAIKNGNRTFVATAGPGNTGGGVVTPGTVSEPALWNSPANSKDFTIKFDVSGGVTSYDIVDNVNNVSMLTGAAPGAGPYLRSFTPGSPINLSLQAPPDTNPTAFDFGAAITIEGSPGSGDAFSLRASSDQDVFKTLHDLQAALSATGTGVAAQANFQNAINSALMNIDNALDNVLVVRSGVGSRLREVETAQTTAGDLTLQYDARLSALQDVDEAKAISELLLQQTLLQAAQQSFLRVTSLNLFSLL